jgi:DNA-binding MarR family transcriptional regulator
VDYESRCSSEPTSNHLSASLFGAALSDKCRWSGFDRRTTQTAMRALIYGAGIAGLTLTLATARGVTLPQFRMLVVLEAGPTNLSGLAAALDVAPSTTKRMVDRLVDAGLVQRAIPPADRREIALTLTPAGRRTARTVTERRRRDLGKVIEQIPRNRRAAVARAMTDLAKAAEHIWGAPNL